MSLSNLFTDRKARKYIKESLCDGVYVGNGICERCSNESENLIKAFGVNLCESCSESVYALAENYDFAFVSEQPTYQDIVGSINEEFFYADIEKIEKDAIANFNGSVPRLLKSYGIDLRFDWNEKYADGQISIKTSDITSGTTKLNQFLLDYDGYYRTAKGAGILVPDADGTLLPADRVATADIKRKYKNQTKNLMYKDFDRDEQRQKYGLRKNPNYSGNATPVTPSSPSVPNPVTGVGQGAGKVSTPNTSNNTTSSAVAPKKTRATVQAQPQAPKLDIEGDINKFTIKFGKGLGFECTLANSGVGNNYEVVLVENGSKKSDSTSINVMSSDVVNCADEILEIIKTVPNNVLPSLAGYSGGNYEINKYGVYKFKVDEYSFGKTFSLCIVYDGKASAKNRVVLSDKAAYSQIALNKELIDFIDKKIKSKYSVLFDNSSIKTSVGKAFFNLEGFNEDKDPIISMDLGSNSITDVCKNLGSSVDTLYLFIFNHLEKIIKGYTEASIKEKVSDRDRFCFDIGKTDGTRKGYTIYAALKENELLDSGNIIFGISVLDSYSGNESKTYDITFKNLGNSMKEFLTKNGTDIYKKEFRISAKDSALMVTPTAKEKMEVSSKKQALFDKISGIFVKNCKNYCDLSDLEVDVRIDVDKYGMTTFAEITIEDPYQDVASSGKLLASVLELEKSLKFLRLVKSGEKGKTAYVQYTVKDLPSFTNFIKLYLIESMIREAFDIVTVNEGSNGRKVFTI